MFKKVKNLLKKTGRGIARVARGIFVNAKAAVRASAAALVIPTAVTLAVAQKLVVGPLFRNHTFLRKVVCKMACFVLGYRIEFNKASAPIAKGKDTPVWSVLNHQSSTDPLVAGSFLNGSFVGKGDILSWPLIAQLAQAGGFIGVRRSSKFNPESRAKIIKNFNQGHNTIMFPEGTVDDSKEVRLFRAALPKLLYGGEEGEALDRKGRPVELEKDVVLQPVAIRVKEVDGQVAGPSLSDAENDEIRQLYSSPRASFGFLGKIWKRLQMDTTLEVTVFPTLDPKAFDDAEELLTKAALDVASAVNPGQKEFRKARIPASPAP